LLPLGQRLAFVALWTLILTVPLGGQKYALAQEKAPLQEIPAPAPESPPATAEKPVATAGSPEAKTEAPPAQPEDASTPSSVAAEHIPANAPVVEQPPVYYVRDKQGRLVPLLGFSSEEILEYLQQKKSGQLPLAAPKQYSLEQLVITGQAHGDHVELTADYKIHLDNADGVNVPLLNSGAVLQEPIAFHGDAEHQLQFDSATGSYTLRLRGAAGSEQHVSLKLVAPLKSLAAQYRLEINLPTAAASRFTLLAPQAPIELVSHAGCTMAEVKPLTDIAVPTNSAPPTQQQHNRSEITLWGLGGALSLAWQEQTAGSAAAVLEATGQVFAQIDSRSVQFDALLTVRGFGAQFDKFHVKLPPGAQLTGGAPLGANYTLTATAQPNVTPPTGAGSPLNADPSTGNNPQTPPGEQSDAQWVEVQLAQPTSEPVDVHIQAERAYDVTKPNQTLELAGFEIQEAAPHRQWGHLAVAVVGDWQLGWTERNRVRQIAELPEPLQRKGVVAGFEYFGQPASLTARVMPRRTRISVEPEYVYLVQPRQLKLEARLKYTIRGAKTSTLEIALPGWELDDWGPSDMVDVNAAPPNHAASFAVPLLQATSGEFEITLKAHRDLPANTSRVEISLPLPTADVIGPALVALVPADNVRLRARDDELQGLVHPSVPPRLTLPSREQAPLLYRGEQPQATFVGDLEQLPQAISAAVHSELKLKRDVVSVEQQFTYRIEHEPAVGLTFDVPPSLLANAQLAWSIDGQTLTASAPGPNSADSKNTRLVVSLPEPRVGQFQIVAQYQIPLSQSVADQTDPLHGRLVVPLAMPTIPTLDYNRVTVNGESASRVQALDDAWTVAEEPLEATFTGKPPALQLTASQPTPLVTLACRPESTGQLAATVVERAWLQTWLSGLVRQDRAVYRFSTSSDQLALSLPAGVTAANLELQLDHRQLSPAAAANGTLTVKLPPGAEDQQHVLELRYQVENVTPGSHTIETNLPRLPDGVWVQRLYWQLVLPSDEQLLSSPPELTPEFTWQWSGLGWSRKNSWDQPELEKWVSATPEDALPQATNRYLFSTLGSTPKIVVRWAARWQIVLGASAAVLVVGLLLMYLPLSRRPWILFAAGVVLVALSVAMPDAALLLAQAAVLGCMLIFLAGWLKRIVARRRTAGKIVPAGGSSIVERSSLQRKVRPLEFAGAASTSTQGIIDLPAADSH